MCGQNVPVVNDVECLQARLVREMEKKFSGKHIVAVAQVCCF